MDIMEKFVKYRSNHCLATVQLEPYMLYEVKSLKEYVLESQDEVKNFVNTLDTYFYDNWNSISFIPFANTKASTLFPVMKKFECTESYCFYLRNIHSFLFQDMRSQLQDDPFLLKNCPALLEGFGTLFKIHSFGMMASCDLQDLEIIASDEEIDFFHVPSYNSCEGMALSLKNLRWRSLQNKGTLNWTLTMNVLQQCRYREIFREMHDVFCKKRFRIVNSFIILKGQNYLTPFHMDDHSYPHYVMYKCMKGHSIIFNFKTFAGMIVHAKLMKNLRSFEELMTSEECESVTELKMGDSVVITPFSFHLFCTVSDSINFAVEAESSSMLLKVSNEVHLILGADENRLK